MTSVRPHTAAPALEIDTLDGERWVLSERRPQRFTMVVFYRGLHCPVCTAYIGELATKAGEFEQRGVDVLAVSGDGEDKARQAQSEWKLDGLAVGYGLPIEVMRAWGLFISSGLDESEPDAFGEPGLFLIEPGGDVYLVAVNSMPFGRPKLDDILDGIDFVTQKDYPARGVA